MNVSEVVNDLFKNVAYSNEFQRIKNQIYDALEKEYEKNLEIYKDNLLAMSHLLQDYGTLKTAGMLAGFTEEEISIWESTETVLDYKDFKKYKFKSRIHIILFSFFITLFIGNFFSLIYTLNLFYLIPVFLCIIYPIFFVIKYKKWIWSDHNFSCDAYDKIEYLSSQYYKKTINTILLFIFSLSTTISLIFLTNYRGSELLSSIFSTLIIYEGILFCLIKNISYNLYFHFLITTPKKKEFKRHLLFVSCAALGYSFLVVPIICMVPNRVGIILGIVFGVLYFILAGFYILKFRKNITLINLRINKMRIVLIGLGMIVLVLYLSMRLDSWLLQPYINQIPAVETSSKEILYDDASGVYTIKTEQESFKILQLTDIHLGGSNFSYDKDKRALYSVYRIIEYTKPDLVIVTGDLVFPVGIMSFSFNNNAPIMQFASFMRNIGIPWAFTYGNHDTESLAVLSEDAIDSLFKSLSFKRSRNLLYPYRQPSIYGRNNQIIEIRGKDNQLIQALFLLDSNSYIDTGINNYDYIHDDQVDWYEENIKKLKEKEKMDVSSLVFFHMPISEYKEAYDLYKKNSPDVTYHFGEIGEKNEDICISNYQSRLFESAVKLGSTKAMFCGHDHLNNIALTYKGIMLTYGLSIDYLAYPNIKTKTEQRGGTLITLYGNSSLEVLPIKLKDIPLEE